MYGLDWQGQTTLFGFKLSEMKAKLVNWSAQEQVIQFVPSGVSGVPPTINVIRGAGVPTSPHTSLITMLMDELSPAMDAMNAGGLNIGTVQQGLWNEMCLICPTCSFCLDGFICQPCSGGGGGGGGCGPDEHGHGGRECAGPDPSFVQCTGAWHTRAALGATRSQAARRAIQVTNEVCANAYCQSCCAWRTRTSESASAPEPDCICTPMLGDFGCGCVVWGRECEYIPPPP